MKKCAFTGHRDFGLDNDSKKYTLFVDKIRSEIENLIKDEVSYFYNGMAVGSDILCAELVLEFKKQYPNIQLECAIPYKKQSERFFMQDKLRYDRILSECDTKTLLQAEYTKDCYQKRNIYMVDRSDYLIALYNGTKGGTKNTIDYALKKDIKIIYLNPNE